MDVTEGISKKLKLCGVENLVSHTLIHAHAHAHTHTHSVPTVQEQIHGVTLAMGSIRPRKPYEAHNTPVCVTIGFRSNREGN